MGRKPIPTLKPKNAAKPNEPSETLAAAGITVPNTPPVDVKALKVCPKCGEVSSGPYQDSHGLFRCNCSHPKCGFWDSRTYHTAAEAARGWQAAGGPDRNE